MNALLSLTSVKVRNVACACSLRLQAAMLLYQNFLASFTSEIHLEEITKLKFFPLFLCMLACAGASENNCEGCFYSFTFFFLWEGYCFLE